MRSVILIALTLGCDAQGGGRDAGPDQLTKIRCGDAGWCSPKEYCSVFDCDSFAAAHHSCTYGVNYSCSALPPPCANEPTCSCLMELGWVACGCAEPREVTCVPY
jgi:hypothetical protein